MHLHCVVHVQQVARVHAKRLRGRPSTSFIITNIMLGLCSCIHLQCDGCPYASLAGHSLDSDHLSDWHCPGKKAFFMI